jgi:hypothetical protein
MLKFRSQIAGAADVPTTLEADEILNLRPEILSFPSVLQRRWRGGRLF